jgi:pimeloyl-ACP methyl ester carboxylesterase
MPVNTAQTLAILSDDAYADHPALGLPDGFSAADLPGIHSVDGLYTAGHAAAAISTGMLDGQQVLVVAFRGTDDVHDLTRDVFNIDDEYSAFKPLAKAIEQYAAAGGKVVLTGHSAGGAMAQVFMSEHAGDDHYRAVTFGSPGALPEKHVFAAATDTRITNYAVSDDPVVYLGEHRNDAIAAVANAVGGHFGGVVADVEHLTHISFGHLLSAAKSLTGDYVNNGTDVVLPGAQPSIDLQGALDDARHEDLSEHDPQIYVALTGSASVFEPHLW